MTEYLISRVRVSASIIWSSASRVGYEFQVVECEYHNSRLFSRISNTWKPPQKTGFQAQIVLILTHPTIFIAF